MGKCAAALLSLVVFAFVANGVYTANFCGVDRQISGSASNNMDERVWDCKSLETWENCCVICGNDFEQRGFLAKESALQI